MVGAGLAEVEKAIAERDVPLIAKDLF